MAQTLCDDCRLQSSGSGRVGRRRPAPPPFIFYRRWRSDVARLIRLLLPDRTVWPAGSCAQLVAAPVSSLCLIVHFQRVLPSNSRHGSSGRSCARLSRLSRRRRASAEPRSGTASSSACPTSLPPSPTPAPTPCSACRATRLPAGCGGACCSARCTETCTSWRRCMPPTLRDVSVCVNPYATCRGECVGGGQIFFWRKKVFRRKMQRLSRKLCCAGQVGGEGEGKTFEAGERRGRAGWRDAGARGGVAARCSAYASTNLYSYSPQTGIGAARFRKLQPWAGEAPRTSAPHRRCAMEAARGR